MIGMLILVWLFLPSFCQNEELSQANIRIGLLEKRLENINKEVRVTQIDAL